jgi:hypothetical protein
VGQITANTTARGFWLELSSTRRFELADCNTLELHAHLHSPSAVLCDQLHPHTSSKSVAPSARSRTGDEAERCSPSPTCV